MWVQIPCLPLVLIDERGSMVKRTSCLASNEMFQVRILVELLNMVSVVYVVRTPACEAGGTGSTPVGYPWITGVCFWEASGLQNRPAATNASRRCPDSLHSCFADVAE